MWYHLCHISSNADELLLFRQHQTFYALFRKNACETCSKTYKTARKDSWVCSDLFHVSFVRSKSLNSLMCSWLNWSCQERTWAKSTSCITRCDDVFRLIVNVRMGALASSIFVSNSVVRWDRNCRAWTDRLTWERAQNIELYSCRILHFL